MIYILIFCHFKQQDEFEPTAEAETHQRLKAMWSSEDSISDDDDPAGGWTKVFITSFIALVWL